MSDYVHNTFRSPSAPLIDELEDQEENLYSRLSEDQKEAHKRVFGDPNAPQPKGGINIFIGHLIK